MVVTHCTHSARATRGLVLYCSPWVLFEPSSRSSPVPLLRAVLLLDQVGEITFEEFLEWWLERMQSVDGQEQTWTQDGQGKQSVDGQGLDAERTLAATARAEALFSHALSVTLWLGGTCGPVTVSRALPSARPETPSCV